MTFESMWVPSCRSGGSVQYRSLSNWPLDMMHTPGTIYPVMKITCDSLNTLLEVQF